MYGKLNERKIVEADYNPSCEQTRQEMANYLDDEAKRVNVDSAKKRAVTQRIPFLNDRHGLRGV